jgi:hypothetical protein
MGASRRGTPATVRIMTALAAGPLRWRYGYQLLAETGFWHSLLPSLLGTWPESDNNPGEALVATGSSRS